MREITTNIRDFRDNMSYYLNRLKTDESFDFIKLTRDGKEVAVVFPWGEKVCESIAYKRLNQFHRIALHR